MLATPLQRPAASLARPRPCSYKPASSTRGSCVQAGCRDLISAHIGSDATSGAVRLTHCQCGATLKRCDGTVERCSIAAKATGPSAPASVHGVFRLTAHFGGWPGDARTKPARMRSRRPAGCGYDPAIQRVRSCMGLPEGRSYWWKRPNLLEMPWPPTIGVAASCRGSLCGRNARRGSGRRVSPLMARSRGSLTVSAATTTGRFSSPRQPVGAERLQQADFGEPVEPPRSWTRAALSRHGPRSPGDRVHLLTGW